MEHCTTQTDDTISRQAAIATALEFFVEFLGGGFYENSQKELIARFQRLPFAQSCEYWDAESGYCALHRPSAWLQGWKDGREALRKEMWEDEQDRFDQQTGGLGNG